MTLLTTLLVTWLQAAPTTSPGPQMLFASEKIGAVLAVVLLVFGGLIALLLLTNRRISRLERTAGIGNKQLKR
jgi:hypothetical protein